MGPVGQKGLSWVLLSASLTRWGKLDKQGTVIQVAPGTGPTTSCPSPDDRTAPVSADPPRMRSDPLGGLVIPETPAGLMQNVPPPKPEGLSTVREHTRHSRQFCSYCCSTLIYLIKNEKKNLCVWGKVCCFLKASEKSKSGQSKSDAGV